MGMTNMRIQELQKKVNNGTIKQAEIGELIHELNLTRSLCLDMAKACEFVTDTVKIIFAVNGSKLRK